MSGWGGGYVTDVTYSHAYYARQSPLHLSIACTLGGVMGLEEDRWETLSYLELGCGNGLNALAQAASNPRWQVTAIDFNPAHIASARSFAREAGIDNVTFLEADLGTLAEEPLAAEVPEADVVSAHGLWSWVPQAVRDGIVRLLRARVRAGGIVQLSYNALPAWQGALALQRVIRETGRRLADRSDRQGIAGFKTVEALMAAEAMHLKGSHRVRVMVEQLQKLPVSYLAHEYMNESWAPCYHADVAAALGEAKLDWVASASLESNFPELMLSAEQRAIMERFDDPLARELIKDVCLERSLRDDVFVRGARRLSVAARDAAVKEVVLGLVGSPEDFEYEMRVPAGRATLAKDFYGPILAALAEGPRRVGDLLRIPERSERSQNPAELVCMLLTSGQALPVRPRPGADEARSRRFNRVAAQRLIQPQTLLESAAIASEGLGNPVPCQRIELYACTRLQAGEGEPDTSAWAAALAPELPSAERQTLAEFMARVLRERAPAWRRLGIV